MVVIYHDYEGLVVFLWWCILITILLIYQVKIFGGFPVARSWNNVQSSNYISIIIGGKYHFPILQSVLHLTPHEQQLLEPLVWMSLTDLVLLEPAVCWSQMRYQITYFHSEKYRWKLVIAFTIIFHSGRNFYLKEPTSVEFSAGVQRSFSTSWAG